jgi:hypothetical protein
MEQLVAWEAIQKEKEENLEPPKEDDDDLLGMEPSGYLGSSFDHRENEKDAAKKPVAPMTPEITVRKWYVFSKMIVANEKTQSDDYMNLKYVEFLEAICRAALYLSEDKEIKIYMKVYNLLQTIFEHFEKDLPPNIT